MHILCPHCRNPIELVKLSPHEEIACPSCGSSFCLETQTTTGATLSSGQRLGRFTLLDTLGQGGFGTVYKARDHELDRTVALKVPRAGNLAGPQELDRFLREARSVAQLKHPSIVAVHEAGQADGVPYLVSDFVEGVTLGDLLSARRPAQRQAAELLAVVAEAVHYAHEQGVIHRDLKPSNIMLDAQSRPFVMDFGLAKREAGEITMTVDGQILGTPAYMSPEQARGEGHGVDGRSDVYSLGVILYELLTGELPFRGTKRMLLHQVLHDEPRPPRKLSDAIARDLETVCLKAMAKEPGRRYASAREFAEDLRRWLKGEPILARPIGQVERGWRWCKRNPAVASLLAAVLLVFAAGAAVSSVLAYVAIEARGDAEAEATNARRSEAKAVAVSKDLEKANTELLQSQEALLDSTDNMVTSVARSLLRPLALQVPINRPLPPLSDPESESLWELASSKEERLRLRFVEEALRTPVTTRQLTDRAEVALQAAIGLNETRRTQAEGMLAKRLQAKATPPEQQADVALCLAHLGILDRPLASRTAAALTQAMSKTADLRILLSLSQGLSAVAVRMEPKEAASTLIQAMSRTKDPGASRNLSQGLSALASRTGPKEAAEAAAGLIEVMSKPTDPQTLRSLSQGLSAVTPHMEPKAAAAVLIQAISNPSSDLGLQTLSEGLVQAAARLEPKNAADTAATLTQAMSKTANSAALLCLSHGLSASAPRMEPKEAARSSEQAAATLTQAMSLAGASYTLQLLSKGLAAVAIHMEPKKAVTALTQAMTKTTDYHSLLSLYQGLSAVAGRLEQKDSAEAAATLTHAIGMTTDPNVLHFLAWGLSALAARMEPKDAAENAAVLIQAMTRTTAARALMFLSQGLAAQAARLEPKEAAETAAALIQSMSKTTDPGAMMYLSQGLSAVAARLPAKGAAQTCNQAAALLAQAMSKTPGPGALQSLSQGLAAVVTRLEPKEAAEAAAIISRALSMTGNHGALQSLSGALSAAAVRMVPQAAAATLIQAMSRTAEPAASRTLTLGFAAAAAGLNPKDAAEAAGKLNQALSMATVYNIQVDLSQGLSAVADRMEPNTAAAAPRRP